MGKLLTNFGRAVICAGVLAGLGACGGGGSDSGSASQTPSSQTTAGQATAASANGTSSQTSTSTSSQPSPSTGSVTITWQAPMQNTDGSTLTDLSGYKIHYGTQPGQYDQLIAIDNPGLTRYVIDNLPAGTYYFAMSAVTSAGGESGLSGEASKTIS